MYASRCVGLRDRLPRGNVRHLMKWKEGLRDRGYDAKRREEGGGSTGANPRGTFSQSERGRMTSASDGKTQSGVHPQIRLELARA